MCTKIKIFYVPYLIIISLLILLASSMPANVQATTDSIKIKFALMSLGTPTQKYRSWLRFVEYLEVKTGYDIEIVNLKNFGELKKAIAKNDVDMFFLNSFMFYRLKKSGKASALAQMQNINASTMSHSEIFVRVDSGINKIEDLKGKDFSFVTPVSSGGYLAPKAMLKKYGINTKKDIKEHFTKNVRNSIHNVILNEVQAGTMCGINYKLLSKKLDVAKLKIIAKSDNYPESLIATTMSLNELIRKKLKTHIIGMMQDKKGKEILKLMEKIHEIKIRQFVEYDANVEKITQSLIKQSGIK